MNSDNISGYFNEKYEPKEILGTGASSTVRLCSNRESKIDFAVKIIDMNSGFDTPEILRNDVIREIEILSRVRGHSNIIQLYDNFQGDSFIFLVFELCSSGDLFDYLTKSVNFSEKKTKVIMKQIFDAVEFIHERGIIHRDLKPENILLDHEMRIKITDFGLAVFENEKEELTEVRGTPGYLAPEILRSGYYEDQEPYGFPVDLWACGVIMYTLLFGCPPFWNRKEHLMLRSIMEGKYSFPTKGFNEINSTAKDLISQLLQVDHLQRLTASMALQHNFFFCIGAKPEVEGKNLRRKLRASFICLSFISQLKSLKKNASCLSTEMLATDPYSHKRLRKIIDTMAFDIYSQWVKKGQDQNRAALFKNSLHIDRAEDDRLDSEGEESFHSGSETFDFDEDQ